MKTIKNFWDKSLLLALCILLFSQCTSTPNSEPDTPEFNEYVTTYSSGSLPRKADIQVTLSQDIAENILKEVKASDIFKFSPSVEGTMTVTDGRTLVFSPSKEMMRNTMYQVDLQLQKIFENGQPFQFSFRTRPFAMTGSLKSFDVTDDDQYILNYTINTADTEEASLVERHLETSAQTETTWTHSPDGTTHLLQLKLNPTEETELEICQTADKSINAGRRVINTISLPSTKTFAVISQRTKQGDMNCVEVTFNKNLDPKQNLKGLIYIKGKECEISTEGNKALLYTSLQNGESIEITIDKSLRSRSGQQIELKSLPSINVQAELPAVQFIGNGTIIPQSDKILVPFRSVFMRGIRVVVYKMFSNMISSVLQNGNISDCDNLYTAARPIAVTTIYVDDDNADLREWHNYAIDLTKQCKLEPGAIYRVELSLDERLSAWPSDSLRKATRAEIAAEDARIMDKLQDQFETHSWYYTGNGYTQNHWWEDNYYEKHKNPASPWYYDNRVVGRNVLATNIGLSALKGTGNNIRLVAINLPDACPMEDVLMEVYSRQQQLIAKGKTNNEGIADIDYETKLGQPYFVIARKGNDVSYLKVNADQALSTSTFDVEGAVIERGLKGYIYGDRGVWRPGDTLHVSFMLNDREKTLPQDHPVTLKLSNPLGQIVNTITKSSGIMGIYTFTIPTAQDAPTGVWNAQVNVGGVNFSKSLRIEAIKPNRLKIELKMPKENLGIGENTAELNTEWLNGNKAHGLKYEIKATLIQTKTSWKEYKDYIFDDPTKSFESDEQEISKGTVDDNGSAVIKMKFNTGETAPGMLKSNLVTHIYEPSGEFSTDVTQSLIAPYSVFVGIKAPDMKEKSHLDTDHEYTYQIATVDKDGKPVGNRSVKVDIYKTQWHWWWSSSRNDMVGYTSSKYNKPVETMTVQTDSQGKGSFDITMNRGDWGTYLFIVKDANGGHSAGTLNYYDWPEMESRRSSESRDNATSLSITTDKKEYAPGETIHLSVPSAEGSQAIVSICNGSKILHLKTYTCQKEHTSIDLRVTDEMCPNIYIAVSLIQQYEQSKNDMPIRMYGITPVKITSSRSHLNPVIQCKDEVQPETTCQVTVSEKEGRAMGYTLAIVDEGLLDLTHFKTPNAWDTFNAREALGVRLWDLYRDVQGAFGGRIEQMFSIGGDEALNNSPKAIVNRFRPMVYFAGPFSLKPGETRTHQIQVPNYNGRVRVMVVAGDGAAYGCTEKSVMVRRPLMLIGTMPRQIGKGDEMTVSATVFASQPLGNVKIEIASSESLQIIGDKSQSVRLDQAGDKTVQFRIKASSSHNSGRVSLKATASNCKVDYTSDIDIRTVSQTISETQHVRIDPGTTFDKAIQMPGERDFMMLMDVTTIQPLNLRNRLNQLIAYPHGCVEQTTSKAFPQLYLNEFSTLSKEQQDKVEKNIKYCINRLVSYQTKNGGLSYWPGGSSSSSWASTYVLHFLTEAQSRGYYVPDNLYKPLKSYVTKKAEAWTSKDQSMEAAYQLYVLAYMHTPAQGTMNRMREYAKEMNETSNMFLAAAYALSGRTDIGLELLETPHKSFDAWWLFSSDVTKLIAYQLLKENQANDLTEKVRSTLASDRWLSTSDCAFSLYALSNHYKKHHPSEGLSFAVNMDGTKIEDLTTDKFLWSEEVATDKKQSKLNVRNNSNAPIYLTATAQGKADQSKIERNANGLELSVSYTTDKDQPLDIHSLQQSTTFKAVVTIRNVSGNRLENIAVTHIIPAGWEILSSLPTGSINYQDLRDDRLLSYIDELRNYDSVTITVKLSATYAGQYYLPSISAEAMYDATISGCTESSECVVK